MTMRTRFSKLLNRRRRCPECGNRSRETHCEVCGYELVQRSRRTTPPMP